jgi:hypothetical protein
LVRTPLHTTYQLWYLSITFLIEYTSHNSHGFAPPFDWVQQIVPVPSTVWPISTSCKWAQTPPIPLPKTEISLLEKKGRKSPPTMKWMPNSMLLPFAHPVSTHLWIILPLSASHNSAKLDPKLQHPALPLSDDLPQNTTNGGHTCSSSTDSSFVFQTLEHSRHNPNPTNAQTCLNNSESNAEPFALNPINITDPDAITNAFLQYRAEFMTLFAHLSSTFSTSDHSVIHGFLHAQIITVELLERY